MVTVRRFVKRHGAWFSLSLTIALVLSSGLYVNEVSQDGFRADASVLLLLLAIGSLIAQVRVDRIRSKPSDDVVHTTIESILEAAARALVHPNSIEDVPVRAFCDRAQVETRTLIPECRWTNHHYEDRNVPIPYDGPDSDQIVIARCFREKKVIAQELPDQWRSGVRAELQEIIWADIRSVLAAPIRDETDPDSVCLGVLCFDTSVALKDVGFDSPQAKDIAVLIASCVYRLWAD